AGGPRSRIEPMHLLRRSPFPKAESPSSRHGTGIRLGALSLVAQVFVEPIERVLPGLFRGGLVVARRRVVVEAVIGAFVDVSIMRHVGFAERLIESRP